jgi:non-ribosomal peptide synthase protein (TIGR01720 family)
MITIDEINALSAKGLRLWVADGKLKYEGPKEVVTPELLATLKQHKAGVIELLSQFAATVGSYPLSYSQKSLWSLHQLNPESPAYNVLYACRLADDLSVDLLRRCLDYLVARHPILRTVYAIENGEPRQRVTTDASARLTLVRMADASETKIRAWIDVEANRPLDLTVSPIRMSLLVNDLSVGSTATLRHVLLLTVHHVAADFWSLEIFVRELSQLYDMSRRGVAPKLPPVALQYKDCVLQEARRLRGVEGATLAQFWESELQGDLPFLNLPTDKVRPPVKTENGVTHELALGQELSAAIKSAAKACKVTPHIWLLSVYQLFLLLHTGQQRMLIGVPTAGRNLPGSEGVMGHFVNTLPLLCSLDPAESFGELVAKTRTTMLRALDHQDFPFPLLVEKLRPPREPSRSPLFQIVYNWNQLHRGGPSGHDGADASLTLDTLAVSSTGTRGAAHDITLNIYDLGASYATAWTFNTDLFDERTVGRYARQFARLIEQVLAAPARALAGYQLADPLRSLPNLGDVAVGALARAGPTTLVGDFCATAAQLADRLAAALGDRRLLYKDLLARFEDWRGALADGGVKPGARVAVDIADPCDRALAALALIDADALLDFDVDRPAGFLLSSAGTADSLGWREPTIASIGAPAAASDGTHDGPFDRKQLTTFVSQVREVMGIGRGSRVMAPADLAPHFVLAQWIAALSAGASLHGALEFSPDLISRSRISVLALPVLRLAALDEKDIESVETLTLVGEHFAGFGRWSAFGRCGLRLLPTCKMGQPGPIVSFRRDSGDWVLNAATPGMPLVVGHFGHSCDDGDAGRLHWATDGQETVETAFIVKRRSDGQMALQSTAARVLSEHQADFSIDTVAAFLARQEGVRQAVCLRVSGIGPSAYVAYVLRQHTELSPSGTEVVQLKRRLKQCVPEFMHPRAILLLDSLPLNAVGELDESRLPAIPAATDSGHAEPTNQTEALLARIWCEVLGVERVSIQANFFELGGDSIQAAVIISKAAIEGLHFSPRDIFGAGTIAELAAVARAAPEVRVDQGAVVGEIVTGPAAAWFFEHITEDLSHFNQSLLIRLNEVPTQSAMASTVDILTAHHDILGSRFAATERGWRHIFGAPAERAAKASFTIAACPDRAAQDRAIADAQRSLDIHEGPLWNVFWLDTGDLSTSRLLIVAHHLVVDGLSWSILLGDLARTYLAVKNGETVRLPAKTSSFLDWIAERRRDAERGAPADETGYWRRTLEKIVERRPRTEDLSAPNRQANALRMSVTLDEDTTTRLRAEAHRAYNTDANDLIVAALAAAFADWWKTGCVLIDVEGHGRDSASADLDIGRTIGWFTCIYPVLLTDVATDDQGRLVKHVKQTLRDVPKRGGNFGLWRHMSDAASTDTRAIVGQIPRAAILFTYMGAMDQLVRHSPLYSGVVEAAPDIRGSAQRRTHEFDIVAYIANERLTIECVCDSARVDGAAIEARLGDVRRRLLNLVAHCCAEDSGGVTPSDVPDVDLDQAELDKLLEEIDAA